MGRRAGDRVEVSLGEGDSYFVVIRSIEKGADDGSVELNKF